jgi:ELWxxDGT repeat protein
MTPHSWRSGRTRRRCAKSVLSGRRARVEQLEDRRLLAGDLELLKDINTTVNISANSAIASIVDGAGVAYFVANDAHHGNELWRSDGTDAGTFLVKDINPGPLGASAANLFFVDDTLYFSADDGVHGLELWKSDGTEAGTAMVADLVAESGDSTPSWFAELDGDVYFFAATGPNARGLWRSDGTAANTVLLKGFTGTAFDSPDQLINVGGTLYFTANDGIHGNELWKSDGTASGTVLVKDLSEPPLPIPNSGSEPFALTDVNGTLYFVTSGVGGFAPRGLWRSDGTADGTILVAPESGFSITIGTETEVVGTNLFFTASTSAAGQELWKLDTVTDVASMVRNIRPGSDSSSPKLLTAVGNTLFFSANDGTAGIELWKSDGTVVGTILVADLNPGLTNNPQLLLTAHNGALYFLATDGMHGLELWKSNGTAAGTMMVKDILPSGGAFALNYAMASVGDSVYFRANDGVHGQELWKTSGTEAGTTLVKDISITPGYANPDDLTVVGDWAYFRADDGVHGTELWRTDGTAAGTTMVADIQPGSGSSFPNGLVDSGGALYFRANDGVTGPQIWRLDGVGTPVRVTNFAGSANNEPWNLTDFNGVLYFSANDGVSGTELWKTDGTPAGAVRVGDIAPGAASSSPSELTPAGNVLYFTANEDSDDDFELWRTDGTEAGTTLVKFISSGFGDPTTQLFYNDGKLFFTTPDDQLWISDGTPTGTTLLKDFSDIDGAFSSSETSFVALDGFVYFTASTSSFDYNLWRSDGTVAGTTLFTHGGGPILVGSEIYFVSGDDVFEIWKTDGTTEGTLLVKAIDIGTKYLGFGEFVDIEGVLYFSLVDSNSFAEIWTSDGTSAGTVSLGVLPNPQQGTNLQQITRVRDRLLTVGRNVDVGSELWALTLPPISGDYDGNRRVDGNDFLAWQRGLGTPAVPAGSGADGDGSGTVDALDLTFVRDNFGAPQQAAPAVAAAVVASESQNADAVDAVFAAGDFTGLFATTPEVGVSGSRNYRPRRRF